MVGYSGGKDSTMLASVVFEALKSIDAAERTKEIAIVCTDTRVEIPAVVERVSAELSGMQKRSEELQLGISTHLLSPLVSQSFWVT